MAYWGVVVCSDVGGGRPCVSWSAIVRFVANLCKEAVSRGINVVNRKPVMITSSDQPRGSLESWMTCCHDLLERGQSLGQPQLFVVVRANYDAM